MAKYLYPYFQPPQKENCCRSQVARRCGNSCAKGNGRWQSTSVPIFNRLKEENCCRSQVTRRCGNSCAKGKRRWQSIFVPIFNRLKEENCVDRKSRRCATPAQEERKIAKYLCPYFQPPQRRKLLSIASHSTLQQLLRQRKKYHSLFSTASKKKIDVDRKSLDAAATPAPKEKYHSLFSTASKKKIDVDRKSLDAAATRTKRNCVSASVFDG